MKFKNPCKRCIVQAACSQICEDKYQYAGSLSKIEATTTMSIMVGLIILLVYLLKYVVTNNPELSRATQLIFHLMGIVFICVFNFTLLAKIGKYFNKEKQDYLDQQRKQLILKHENLHQQYRPKTYSNPSRRYRIP
jgi:hypothetical protein